MFERGRPVDLANRVVERRAARSDSAKPADLWRRATFRLPRLQARDKAREWFDRFPKAAYMTEIEFWREMSDGEIEFVIRRLPSAD